MKLVLFFAILWVNEASFKEVRSRSKTKPKPVKPSNMCTLEPTDTNSIRCFCTKDKYQVLSAECWIFEPVTKESFIWRLIVETQPYLSDFSIIASNQGQLKSIPPQFLQKMLFLKNLTVSFALLDKLEKHVLGNSTSIQKLKLCKNQIELLEIFSIANLLSLKEIDLSGNRIRSIPNYVFFNVPELKYVRLNNNNISKIDDKAFSSLGNVLELDLSENYICDINNLTFFGLSKLKVMDLSVNKIVNLVSSVFSELWDIEELYLDDNYIEFISNRAFDGLRFLKTLSLGNNRLTRFPAGLFASVFTLVNMDLSNNRLETLVFDSIEQFYNNLLQNGTIEIKARNAMGGGHLQYGSSTIQLGSTCANAKYSIEIMTSSDMPSQITVVQNVASHSIAKKPNAET